MEIAEKNTHSIELDGIEYTYIFTGGLIRIIAPELCFSDEVKIISRIHFESYMKAVNKREPDFMRSFQK